MVFYKNRDLCRSFDCAQFRVFFYGKREFSKLKMSNSFDSNINSTRVFSFFLGIHYLGMSKIRLPQKVFIVNALLQSNNSLRQPHTKSFVSS